MKKHLLKTIFCLLAITATVQCTIAQAIPEKIVEITKKDVIIRAEASNTATELEKAALGKQYELVSTQGSWLKVKDPINGKIGFVQSSVTVTGKPTLISPFLKANSNKEYKYTFDATATQGYERSFTYSLYEPEDKKGTIQAWYTDLHITIQGKVTTAEYSYKGKINGWYIALNKISIAGEEEETDITPPSILYKSIAKPGFYNDGHYFESVEASTF